MSLKIFHTADIHIGMVFAGYPDEVREKLVEARFDSLKKMVNIANEENCNLFVIAGDLFHKKNIAKKDISKTCKIINEFHGDLVAILPGNHDYITFQEGDTWSTFKDYAGDNVILLENNKYYNLQSFDMDAAIYAAPCDSKHSEVNLLEIFKENET